MSGALSANKLCMCTDLMYTMSRTYFTAIPLSDITVPQQVISKPQYVPVHAWLQGMQI